MSKREPNRPMLHRTQHMWQMGHTPQELCFIMGLLLIYSLTKMDLNLTYHHTIYPQLLQPVNFYSFMSTQVNSSLISSEYVNLSYDWNQRDWIKILPAWNVIMIGIDYSITFHGTPAVNTHKGNHTVNIYANDLDPLSGPGMTYFTLEIKVSVLVSIGPLSIILWYYCITLLMKLLVCLDLFRQLWDFI